MKLWLLFTTLYSYSSTFLHSTNHSTVSIPFKLCNMFALITNCHSVKRVFPPPPPSPFLPSKTHYILPNEISRRYQIMETEIKHSYMSQFNADSSWTGTHLNPNAGRGNSGGWTGIYYEYKSTEDSTERSELQKIINYNRKRNGRHIQCNLADYCDR